MCANIPPTGTVRQPVLFRLRSLAHGWTGRSVVEPRARLPHPPTRMTWIRTTPLEGDEEALARAREMQRALYPMMYGQGGPPELGGESIVSSHTLIPDALYHAFATFGALMSPKLPLERRQHEMIATMVSVTNRCRY